MIADLLPYPAMKDSGVPWLGEVPEHWEAAAVRRYCRVFAGATPSRAVPEYWRGGYIPWLASGDVNLRRITGARQFITEAGYAASSTKWIRSGSLVLALAGQGRTKGMVATVECRTTCNQSLAAIEPSPRRSNYRFLAYYLESRYLDLRALVGDGLRDGLNLQHVRAIATPLPPLPEQAAIVRFLDHADRRIRRYIRAKQKLIKLLEEQKQAIIHRAVTRGLDPNVRLKPSGVEWLGDVPEHWEVASVGELCRYLSYGFTNPMPAADWGPFMLTANDIGDGVVSYESARRTTEDAFDHLLTKKSRPMLGDVLVTKDGTLGRVAVADGRPACINQSIALLRVDADRMLPEFLSFVLRGPLYQERMIQDAGGSTIKHIYITRLAKMKIASPGRNEQSEILANLSNDLRRVELALDNAEREISLLREYRTRLIADVVTGKLDVREAAAHLPHEAEEPAPLDETDAMTDPEEGTADDLDAAPEEVEA